MKEVYSLGMLIIIFNYSVWSQNINYTRLTEGLNVPTFEGGRSDFCFSDIDNDGHVDILSIGDHGNPLINSTQQGLLIWFNKGNNTFQNYMTGYFGYGGIVVGDVNNDGWKDIGFGMHHNYSTNNFGDQLIEVALGDGTSKNWIPWDVGLATNGETWGMFGTDFADVNNDGRLDLVSISFGSGGGMHVYLNNGNGTWTQSFGFLDNNSDNLVQFCDINNDGFIDIISSHAYGTAWFGDGTGNFLKNDNGLPPLGSYGTRDGISVGDVNNDGGFGVAFVNNQGGVKVYEWNNESNKWEDYSGNLPATGNFQLTQLGDMNADGFTDIMAFGKKTFKLWLGNGMGNWTEGAAFQTPFNQGNAKAFRAGGDLNKTGIGDIVMLVEEGSFINYKNYLYVYADNSTPDSLWIRTLYPRGNEKFYPGSANFIQWASAVPAGASSWVKIEISAFGPEGPWWLVADSLPNNGEYQWLVPDLGSQNCYLRLTVFTAENAYSDITRYPFTIIGEPTFISQKLHQIHNIVIPSPGKEKITILAPQENFIFILRNIAGTEVLRQSSNKTIEVSHLPAGIYIYELIINSHTKISGKWLKY